MRRTLVGSLVAPVLGAAMAFLVTPVAADPMLNLPADTIAVVSVSDMSDLRDKWKASKFHEAWSATEMTEARTRAAKFWEEIGTEFQENAGLKLDELFNTLDGNVAFVLATMEFRDKGDGPEPFPGLGVVADVPADKQDVVRRLVDKALEDVPETAAKSSEELRGTKIYKVSYTETVSAGDLPEELQGLAGELNQEREILLQYAFTKDRFLFFDGPGDPLKSVLNALENDAAPRLGTSDGFKRISTELGSTGDINAYINPSVFFDLFRKLAPDTKTAQSLEAAGLFDFGPALVSVGLDGEGLWSQFGATMPAEKRGVMTMLYAGAPNTMSLVKGVPADALSFATWTLDLEPVWKAARQMIVDLNPEAEPGINMGLMTAKSNFNVDVENDIIAHIRGEHLFYQLEAKEAPVEGMPKQMSRVFMIGLKDGDATVKSLDGLFTLLSGEQFNLPAVRSEHRGFAMWAPKPEALQGAPISPSLVLTPSALLFSTSQADAQEAIRRLAGETGPMLAEKPEVRDAMARVKGANLRAFSYTDPAMFDVMAGQFEFGFRMALDSMASNGVDVDMPDKLLPRGAFWTRYFGSQHQTVELRPNALVSRSRWYTAK